jgi:hypothetical protein
MTDAIIRTTRTPACACLNCGLALSGATGWEGRKPKPGNGSVCVRCGHFMVFADDLTMREPTDEEIIEWGGERKMLFGQKVAHGVRKSHEDWRKVEVPVRMRHLPRDPRGFPIFAMAFRDSTGRAHFTINDETERMRMIHEDCCSVCGKKLLRGRWFIGGEKSAFHPRGVYLDPPMHAECARYALRVCPYLASPSYDKLIHGATMRDGSATLIDPTSIVSPSTADEVRPVLFVAVLARGQRTRMTEGGCVIKPSRPYIRVEYWQHGYELAAQQGEAICRSTGVDPRL